MSLSALVYKNQSLIQDELAIIDSKDRETGEPLLRSGDSAYPLFAAQEIFIGNLLEVAGLRDELERSAPQMSGSIRKLILSNGTLSGVGIGQLDVSRIVSECKELLADGQVDLSKPLLCFLVALSDLAKTAIQENSPITLV
ncbi:hypothetical protein HDF16_006179 [Granulicella aggregans]|uniref:Uncharacterized protein n=1 Tax=Granulicella aggregans TaxID=474949 RepID=A0A7W8E6Q0_9BACT|nr:hypothetical protein [Granulicella aggregans]MBB5061443.1 hypothetical protein [Granulicella aggregans]